MVIVGLCENHPWIILFSTVLHIVKKWILKKVDNKYNIKRWKAILLRCRALYPTNEVRFGSWRKVLSSGESWRRVESEPSAQAVIQQGSPYDPAGPTLGPTDSRFHPSIGYPITRHGESSSCQGNFARFSPASKTFRDSTPTLRWGREQRYPLKPKKMIFWIPLFPFTVQIE